MLGRRLAHYEITAHLGSGGMGEVYQATDTKLGRTVALKFLPENYAQDRERIARFRQEARTLASLNHPHIAAIHGLEEADGPSFLVMEHVPGQTLAERIRRRPLPLEAALGIARQIAEALEAAHEKGVVHRDLKPANVKITPDGQVKVLDFGLAKFGAGVSDEPGGEGPTAPITHTGVILGTAAYMAPEQAKGQPVDQRADVFAFGCVLYEMLAGRPAFDGESVPDIISRVLQREPDWTQLPSSVPPSIHRLIRLCLEKDPRKRRQSAGDVRIDLEHALTETASASATVASRRSQMPRLAWIASAVVLITALAIPAAIHLREAPPSEVRLQIPTRPTLQPLQFALSPDGHYIVFVASGSSSDVPQRLYLRALNDTEAKPLAGTDGAFHPFWATDSRSIGFFASGRLQLIDIAGGPPRELAHAANPQGGTWNEDGTILFSPNSVSPLLSVAASGGTPVEITELDSPRQTGHTRPSFLPGGRQFLFYAVGDPEVSGIYLGSLDGGAAKRLTPANTTGTYLKPDHIVFVQEGALIARRFDAAREELTGDPVTLAASVGQGGFSTSTTGILAYRAGGGVRARMTWFDGKGKVLGQGGDLNGPDLSANGRYLAYDRTIQGNRDVWFMDLDRGGDPARFTTHASVDGFPVWSPDGSQIVFHSQRNGTFDIWIKPFSGAADTEELLHGTSDHEWPLDWSNDGRFLLYRRSSPNYASSDLLALPMTGNNRTPIVVAGKAFDELLGEFSPDGRWVAYETHESGRAEIVVQAFPEPSGIVHVSTSGGAAPRWSVDGKQIFFIGPDGKMMAVPVTVTRSTFEAGKPVPLFSLQTPLQYFRSQYAVSRDGRFVANNLQVDEASVSPITVILNLKP